MHLRKLGKAYYAILDFSAPLKLKIIKTPKPIERGTQRVSNIQMQDKEGTKVRMTLWNKDLDRFPELESNLVCFCLAALL